MTGINERADSQSWHPGEPFSLVQTGVFSEPDEDGAIHLLGQRCKSCGASMFPRSRRCVSCFSEDLADIKFDRTGRVDSFTTVHQAPPGYLGPVPYVLAMVILGNGVHVLAHLTGRHVDEWRRGELVSSRAIALTPGNGDTPPRLGFAFGPADNEETAR